MSQKACPHCGSTNHIETAGQIYSADCGQLIDAGETKIKPEVKKPQPKKNQTKAVAHKAPTKSPRSATAPPLNLKAIEKARSMDVKKHGPGLLDLKNSKPAPKKVSHTPKQVARVASVPVIAADQEEPVFAEPNITKDEPLVARKRFRYKNALRDGFKTLTVGKTFRLALWATVVTTASEAVFIALFAKSSSYAITESINAGSVNAARATTLIDHLGWAGLLGMVGYLVYHYALAAVIFRTSRAFDRRGVSSAQTRRAGLGSLSGLFGLDVITWLLAVLSMGLVAGANVGFLATKSLGVWGVALAVVTNLFAIYLWLGLVAARHMATYAVVLGQVGVMRAYGTGWRLYNRQFGRLITALIIIFIVIGLLALPTSLLQLLLPGGLAILAVYPVAAITQSVILVVGAVYFLRLYRFIVSREYDSDLGHLLTGRQPQQKHVRKRIISLILIIIVWSAGMSYLVLNAPAIAHNLIR